MIPRKSHSIAAFIALFFLNLYVSVFAILGTVKKAKNFG
jgi:hypothetical protein